MEPLYIRQTAEPMDKDARLAWFKKCADEAKKEGARLARFTVYDDGKILLIEAWHGSALEVGDQGKPRWQLTQSADN
jgi:hypothetical protein